ncbi:pyrroloquinoline quinone biosynthesis peptide chaperone PqqD [Pseudonocardia sp. K10HN5]|uniref:Pyrroloquinoline quinone biosynthesis peptide chaperone PqqD n=1 Tax=Pseudonocardia acidicola TaxID=2724939 RepID=A0ABX1SM56_9PSEU|nr:pyrroloquinoline quinone biosynthesis peptide chaperone PqqD [Pseudonocardia acidicola]
MASSVPLSGRPRLARHVRLVFDGARGRHMLLGPESVVVLNRTGADILGLCDGHRTVAEIVAELRGRYQRVAADEVCGFLAGLLARRRVEISDG